MEQDVRKVAERFMQEQISIMKKYGSEPHLSSERYEQAVVETQRTFSALDRSSEPLQHQQAR